MGWKITIHRTHPPKNCFFLYYITQKKQCQYMKIYFFIFLFYANVTKRLPDFIREALIFMVRITGVEPAPSCPDWHLKPARLPIPPYPLIF